MIPPSDPNPGHRRKHAQTRVGRAMSPNYTAAQKGPIQPTAFLACKSTEARDLENLKAVQDSRPLKPPRRKKRGEP